MKQLLKWIGVVVGAVLMIAVMKACDDSKQAAESKNQLELLDKLPPEKRRAETLRLAVIANKDKVKSATKRMVLEALKAPYTATVELDASGNSTNKSIVVTGYVDAQNSFGAMLRSKVYAEWDTATLTCTKFTVE